MRKMLFTALFLSAALLVTGGCGKAGYPAKVKVEMDELKESFGALNRAADAKDYEQAKTQFRKIAEAFAELKDVKPPFGTKEEWDKNHEECIAAANGGADACDRKDDAGIKKAIDTIGGNIGKGHRMFKK